VQQENAIRELINQEANVVSVLRLLCLYSLVAGGFKAKQYEDFQREFLQTYGYDYLPALIHLADLSLIGKGTGTKAPFAVCRKPLRLIVDNVDESRPEDISYVYSRYAPVSVRLVQHAIGLGATSGGLPGGWLVWVLGRETDISEEGGGIIARCAKCSSRSDFRGSSEA
jgi:hypothetical protein